MVSTHIFDRASVVANAISDDSFDFQQLERLFVNDKISEVKFSHRYGQLLYQQGIAFLRFKFTVEFLQFCPTGCPISELFDQAKA